MSEWIWVQRSVVLAVHDEQLVEHGGASGVRDMGLLESALVRAPNLAAHGDPDVAEHAAAYGFGIARNHPFVDGNKRAALIAAELFLALNGFDLTVGDAECVVTILALASGELDEVSFAAWLRRHVEPRRPSPAKPAKA